MLGIVRHNDMTKIRHFARIDDVVYCWGKKMGNFLIIVKEKIVVKTENFPEFANLRELSEHLQKLLDIIGN